MIKEMNFHGFGAVSIEELNVVFQNDEVIILSDYEEVIDTNDYESLDKNGHEFDSGDSYWIFNKDSGKCLNDERSFGCYRTINSGDKEEK